MHCIGRVSRLLTDDSGFEIKLKEEIKMTMLNAVEWIDDNEDRYINNIIEPLAYECDNVFDIMQEIESDEDYNEDCHIMWFDENFQTIADDLKYWAEDIYANEDEIEDLIYNRFQLQIGGYAQGTFYIDDAGRGLYHCAA